MNTSPKTVVPHITPQMVASARRALGHCNQCREKIQMFGTAGYKFPDEEQMIDAIQRKAEGIIAAAEMHYGSNG